MYRLSVKYHQNEALAKKIIRCESHFYANSVGHPIVGRDIGYWQINTYYHLSASRKMGLDIFKWKDNLEYGFWLMSEEGTHPWNASKSCWIK